MKNAWIPVFLLICIAGLAQTKPPFAQEVAAFKKQDSLHFPEKGMILLAGSSSFTMWKDVQSYFPNKYIVNRAFGGSSLTDLIRFQQAIFFTYQPQQIVIYCGENDFATGEDITSDTVVNRFQQLFFSIRHYFKKVPIIYVSLKPSPSRKKYLPLFISTNNHIRKFLAKQKRTAFVDIYNDMLNQSGLPNPTLFLADSLHMNAKGYAIWQKKMEPVLNKYYK